MGHLEDWAAAEQSVAAIENGQNLPAKEEKQLPSSAPPKAAPAEASSKGEDEPVDEPEEAAKTETASEKTEADPKTVAERIQWRHRMREERRKLQDERTAAQKWLQEEKGKLELEAKTVAEAKRAIEAGDFDGLAKALGRKGWDDLNREVFERFQDPNYKRVRELEQWKAQQEQQRQELERKQQEEVTRAEQLKQITEYKTSLSNQLKQSNDELLQLAAEDPEFVEAIFVIQQRDYDGADTTSVDEAAKEVLDSIAKNPTLRLRKKLLMRLIKEDEDGVADQSGESSSERPQGLPDRGGDEPREKPRRKSVTQAGATDTAALKTKELSDAEWKAKAIRDLAKSFEQES